MSAKHAFSVVTDSPTSLPLETREDAASDLVTSQIQFGLAYVQEARVAYADGRDEYGDLAREIALRAYSTAVRFAARLPGGSDRSTSRQIAKFEAELDGLLQPAQPRSRSIA